MSFRAQYAKRFAGLDTLHLALISFPLRMALSFIYNAMCWMFWATVGILLYCIHRAHIWLYRGRDG